MIRNSFLDLFKLSIKKLKIIILFFHKIDFINSKEVKRIRELKVVQNIFF